MTSTKKQKRADAMANPTNVNSLRYAPSLSHSLCRSQPQKYLHAPLERSAAWGTRSPNRLQTILQVTLNGCNRGTSILQCLPPIQNHMSIQTGTLRCADRSGKYILRSPLILIPTPLYQRKVKAAVKKAITTSSTT